MIMQRLKDLRPHFAHWLAESERLSEDLRPEDRGLVDTAILCKTAPAAALTQRPDAWARYFESLNL